MKILTLCLSDGFGGLELYVKSCVQFFQANNTIHLVVARKNTQLTHSLTPSPRLRLLHKSKFKPLPLVNAVRLAKLIDQHQPDILHINWGKDLPLAVLAKKLCRHKPKLVYSRHMRISHDKHNIYHRWLYQAVDCLLTVTHQVAQQAEQLLPINPQKITPLYLGVDQLATTSITRQDFFQELHLDPSVFTVLILARMEAAKGQHLGINAVKLLQQQGIKIQLVLIGQAMNQQYLNDLRQQVEQQQLSDFIRFIDFYPQPQRIIPLFDALALTTKQETFGLVLIEAMRCNVAVIGSNAGGVPEIIDDEVTGLLFKSNDAADLAQKIKFYQKNPSQKQQIAAAGKQKADACFDKTTHFAQLMNIYQSLLR